MAYSDALGASLRGRDNLRAYAPLRANLQNARANVTSMVRFAAHDGTLALELTPAPLAKRMEGLDAASIGWTLAAQTPVGAVNLVRSRSVCTPLHILARRAAAARRPQGGRACCSERLVAERSGMRRWFARC